MIHPLVLLLRLLAGGGQTWFHGAGPGRGGRPVRGGSQLGIMGGERSGELPQRGDAAGRRPSLLCTCHGGLDAILTYISFEN